MVDGKGAALESVSSTPDSQRRCVAEIPLCSLVAVAIACSHIKLLRWQHRGVKSWQGARELKSSSLILLLQHPPARVISRGKGTRQWCSNTTYCPRMAPLPPIAYRNSEQCPCHHTRRCGSLGYMKCLVLKAVFSCPPVRLENHLLVPFYGLSSGLPCWDRQSTYASSACQLMQLRLKG